MAKTQLKRHVEVQLWSPAIGAAWWPDVLIDIGRNELNGIESIFRGRNLLGIIEALKSTGDEDATWTANVEIRDGATNWKLQITGTADDFGPDGTWDGAWGQVEGLLAAWSSPT